MLPFSKLNNFFMDTLIQKIYFQITKINNFRGDLTDISAIKEALEGGDAGYGTSTSELSRTAISEVFFRN